MAWVQVGGGKKAADGVGARKWLEMGGKKPLENSELGCAAWVKGVGGNCGRRGCKGMGGNGWGEDAAGGCSSWKKKPLGIGRMAADGVGQGWTWVGEKSRWR